MTRYVFTTDSLNVDSLVANARDALNAGNLPAALRLYERALALNSNDAGLRNDYGLALKRSGRPDEAEREFRRALELDREHVDALVNLADALLDRFESNGTTERNVRSEGALDAYSEAERLLRAALRLGGDRLDALLLLALILERRSQLRECRELLKRARPLHPDPTSLSRFIAGISAKMCDWESAASELERVCAAQPDSLADESRLGDYYGWQGRWERSKEHFRKAAALRGAQSAFRWKHLGITPIFFQTVDEIEEYWRVLDRELDEAIAERARFDWRSLPDEGAIPSFPLAHHNKSCRAIREKFARMYAPSFEQARTSSAARRSTDKIRIGYFALPLEEGVFLRSMAGIIRRLDPSRFEQFFLHLPESASYFREVGGASRIDLSSSFETAVERIRELNLDAIYYRNVGSAGWSYFLPMLRLAPVQVASWGDLGTTGVFDVDYYLSHKLTELARAQDHYTEKLVLLNETPRFEPLRRRECAGSTREELGLPVSGALYFCPHRLAKYHPDFDLYLKEILESDPKCSIILLLRSAECVDSQKVKERIERRVGATLARRLIFLSRLGIRGYDKIFSVSTALLDSSVYSGCLTLFDALALGVPCVSQVGDLCVQRFPVGAYAAMGVEAAPLARNREEYVRLAVEVGTNPDYRRALSQQILERRDLVFERESAVREFEEFWERAVRK